MSISAFGRSFRSLLGPACSGTSKGKQHENCRSERASLRDGVGGWHGGGVDRVLVTTVDDAHTGCRVAVHRDATGRALLRGVAYARAACGSEVSIRLTSIAAEADLELASIGERAGSLLALAVSSDRVPASPPAEEPSWIDSVLAWRSRM